LHTRGDLLKCTPILPTRTFAGNILSPSTSAVSEGMKCRERLTFNRNKNQLWQRRPHRSNAPMIDHARRNVGVVRECSIQREGRDETGSRRRQTDPAAHLIKPPIRRRHLHDSDGPDPSCTAVAVMLILPKEYNCARNPGFVAGLFNSAGSSSRAVFQCSWSGGSRCRLHPSRRRR
jgi:hypothetical protein